MLGTPCSFAITLSSYTMQTYLSKRDNDYVRQNSGRYCTIQPNKTHNIKVFVLSKWCGELKLPVSGSKTDMIGRIIEYYDNIRLKDETVIDEREHWYNFYLNFASRDLDFLRNQQLIQKDIECERKFEQATDYLFEKKLIHKPLKLIGTNHADGALSFQDRVIYWDNKSKETPVNLKDHIKQFDSYIKASEKSVACFFVIGPEFTA